MHVGNGAVTPECAAISALAAVGGLAAFHFVAPKGSAKTEPVTPLLAASAVAGVFAAQMMNLPVSGLSSAHFVGGVWLCHAFGTRLGSWLMASVLVLQAALLGDGGFAALGCNIINMALVPALLIGLAQAPLARASTTRRWMLLAGLAWFSVFVGAGLVALETALGRTSETLSAWPAFAAKMLTVHAVAGLIEASLTVALVAGTEIIHSRKLASFPVVVGAALTAVMLAGVAPVVTSALPDGYEFAAAKGGVEWLLGEPAAASPLASLAGAQAQGVQTIQSIVESESLIALLATAAAAFIAAGVALVPRRRSTIAAS